MGLWFGILGPLLVRVDDLPRPIPAGRQRALLATLVMRSGKPVTTDELLGTVWEDNPSQGSSVLYATMNRLRRSLGPVATERLVRVPGGYQLAITDEEWDLGSFDSASERGRAAMREGDWSRAAPLLDEALSLWRGEPLCDVAWPSLPGTVEHLNSRRQQVLQWHVETELQLGRHAETVAEIEALVAAQPLDERLRGHLMLALYRVGRPAEALAVFREGRRLLRDEAGLDPGRELRLLCQQVLDDDPTLVWEPPAAEVPASPPPVRRNDLPRDLADFTGRDGEVARLLEVATRPSPSALVIEAIDGMAGVGKTALAVHAAHLLADRYTDGQLFLDLRGHTPGADPLEAVEALRLLLAALGVSDKRIPSGEEERAALWRAELAGRRLLVVLDNAAAGQVRPLLPGNPECLVIVTSRQRLLDLAGAVPLNLDVMPAADAYALFCRIAEVDPDGADREAIAEVVRLCGNLPLAIRIAAARLRQRSAWTPAQLAERLADTQGRLAELEAGQLGVAASFALSYEHLADSRRRLFRLLGLVPGGDFDAYAVAALAGLRVSEAETGLEDLLDAHLVEQRLPGRYRFHDLLRDHARQVVLEEEPDQDRTAAAERLLDFYLHTTASAVEGLTGRPNPFVPTTPAPLRSPDVASRDRARTWLETEHANLLATSEHATAAGHHLHGWQLPNVLWPYFHLGSDYAAWTATCGRALTSAEKSNDVHAQILSLKNLGTAHAYAGEFDPARDRLLAALNITQDADIDMLGSIHNSLGAIDHVSGRFQEAVDHYSQSLELCERLGYHSSHTRRSQMLGNLALPLTALGRYDEALACALECCEIVKKNADLAGECYALNALANVYAGLGRWPEALESFQQALESARAIGNRSNEASCLNGLARMSTRLRRFEDAYRYHDEAFALAKDFGMSTDQARLLNDFADTLRADERLREAHDNYRQALALSERSPHEEARARQGMEDTAGTADVADMADAAEKDDTAENDDTAG